MKTIIPIGELFEEPEPPLTETELLKAVAELLEESFGDESEEDYRDGQG